MPEAGPAAADEPLRGPALLVEDSLLIALDVVDLLEELGLGPVHTAASVGDALRYLDGARPVLALLDVSLGAETSQAVARRLEEAGVPFALTTGHGVDGEGVEGFAADLPVLRKPFATAELQALVRKLAGAGAVPIRGAGG